MDLNHTIEGKEPLAQAAVVVYQQKDKSKSKIQTIVPIKTYRSILTLEDRTAFDSVDSFQALQQLLKEGIVLRFFIAPRNLPSKKMEDVYRVGNKQIYTRPYYRQVKDQKHTAVLKKKAFLDKCAADNQLIQLLILEGWKFRMDR